jgi:hypothetical protein
MLFNSDVQKESASLALDGISFKEPSLVCDVHPMHNRVADVVISGTGSATSNTIYTTPTDQDFYLCGACLSLIKDVTSTSTLTQLKVSSGGLLRTLLHFIGFTLTVQADSIACNFNPPIKVDRGTAITLNHGTAAATISGAASVWGYLTAKDKK